MNFRDIGISDKLRMFSNGKQVTDYFESILSGIELQDGAIIQPVSLLLLDINMPVINGIQAFQSITAKYKQLNERLSG